MKSIVQIGFDHYDIGVLSEADLWSCNGLHEILPREIKPAGWFQIHRPEDLYKESTLHIEWLKQDHKFPIWMARKFDEYPASVAMPYEELIKLWPLKTPPSFGSSFSWMVAMAIHMGYEGIEVCGVEFMTEREAWIEAPNFMAWLGIAAGRGMTVRGVGRLFESYMYGREERLAPAWLPIIPTQDLLLDQIDEGRKLLSDWRRRARALYA